MAWSVASSMVGSMALSMNDAMASGVHGIVQGRRHGIIHGRCHGRSKYCRSPARPRNHLSFLPARCPPFLSEIHALVGKRNVFIYYASDNNIVLLVNKLVSIPSLCPHRRGRRRCSSVKRRSRTHLRVPSLMRFWVV